MGNAWVFLSLLSAFGQALGWALKKKTLEGRGVNNTLGFVSFLTAGLILLFLFFVCEGGIVPPLSSRFFLASGVVIFTNILAVWAAYRALDRAALSLLMPFISLSALGIVPVEYFSRGLLPSWAQTIGIVLIVCGSVLFMGKRLPDRRALRALGYFAVTVCCFSVAPPYMGIAVGEVQSGLFAAAVFHLGIALGFVPLAVGAGEGAAIRCLREKGEGSKVFLLIVLAGCVIALLENGPATVALLSAKASEVMALKRMMPLFALVLGSLMFKERMRQNHIFGTILLVGGAMLMVWFRVS